MARTKGALDKKPRRKGSGRQKGSSKVFGQVALVQSTKAVALDGRSGMYNTPHMKIGPLGLLVSGHPDKDEWIKMGMAIRDDSPPLRWWCEVAGIDAGVIVSRFRRENANRPSAYNART